MVALEAVPICIDGKAAERDVGRTLAGAGSGQEDESE